MPMMDLPELTQKPILRVDATPDAEYPLRILRAYRGDCDCLWSTGSAGVEEGIYKQMNEDQRQRAVILDNAIELLELELELLASRRGEPC